MLGGAALTRNYVEVDLRKVYEGRLFYGKDAFEGLHTMDTLMDGKRPATLDPGVRPRRRRPQAPAPQVSSAPTAAVDGRRPAPTSRSTCRSSRRRSSVARVAKGISLDEIAAYINETALVPQPVAVPARQARNETDDEFKERHPPTLRRGARRRRRPRAGSSPRWRGATSRSTPRATT